MYRVTYGNSQSGEVDTEYAEHVGLTYLFVRDDRDNTLAQYDTVLGFWVRHDGTQWTDIDVEVST